ncbi:hypothetical protein SAY87_014126 [Trapa incisa]|uniref:Uncharacterized protein n=1 Tax=Trapa incisa TaxID=236973 RepID=A0AAN7GW29_9MYRT|nr:hypothetical protein SAY87_014126 [Trapa incisa]
MNLKYNDNDYKNPILETRLSRLSDAEVKSQFSIDNDLAPVFYVFNRNKYTDGFVLTSHEMNFIRPLIWRCNWTELRIKENQAQVLRYAKELGLIEQDSHSQLDEYSPVEKLGSKSLQFSRQGSNRKIMIHEEEEEE